jgi:hypothetical protein
MADFAVSDERLRRIEGKWQNIPGDGGNNKLGWGTYRGISSTHHPKWKGWPIIAAEIAKLPPQPEYGTKAYKDWVKELNASLEANPELQRLVGVFYRAEFWNKMSLDDMRSQGTADHVYCHGVNRGIGTAAILLQKLLGVKADGDIGPVTIKAANKMRDNELEALYRAARKADYERIIKINPALAQFRRTWLARC